MQSQRPWFSIYQMLTGTKNLLVLRALTATEDASSLHLQVSAARRSSRFTAEQYCAGVLSW